MISSLFTVPFIWKGRCQHAVIRLWVEGMVMSKNLSCDWSTRFMKVTMLGLSLVRTQKYSPSVQVVYGSTVYMYRNLYT